MAEGKNADATETAKTFVKQLDVVFADRIRSLAMSNDPEHAHYEADKILCAILDFCGFDVSARAFRTLEKWYS